MNGRGRRAKGAAGEREAAAVLSDLLGQSIRRVLGQARDGGHDLDVLLDDDGAYGVLVEVKRQERARMHDWLEQVDTATQSYGRERASAVMWRPSRRGWVVCMPVEDWARLVREAMR